MKIIIGAISVGLIVSIPILALAAEKQTTIVTNAKAPSAVVVHQNEENVQQVSPEAFGVGTISCEYAGGGNLYCPWDVSSSSRISYSGIKVIFSDGFQQNFSYSVPNVYRIYDVAHDTIIEPDTYYAELSGYVITGGEFHQLIPVLSEDVTVNQL